jgi:hypothetical protein
MSVQTTLSRPLGSGAQWGWTAPFFDEPPPLTSECLDAICDLLSSRISREELRSFLRRVQIRLWNHIGQDELATTKADCSQALRELLRQLNKLDRKLNTLTTRARYTFSIALAEEASQGGVISMPLVLQRIHEAASRRNHDSKPFHALAEAAAVALVYYESLDFKSLGIIQQAAMRRDLRSSLPSPEGPYCFGIFVRRLALYRGRIKLALNDLKSRPGPDIPDSLHILVWTLADYYTACTGKPVTNSAARDHSYTATPQSQAGRQHHAFWDQRFGVSFSALHKDKGGPMGPPRWVSWSIPDRWYLVVVLSCPFPVTQVYFHSIRVLITTY